MTVLCGQPTLGGPCRRKVAAPGAPCGMNHFGGRQGTADAAAPPRGPGPDPFTHTPVPSRPGAMSLVDRFAANPAARARIAAETDDQEVLRRLASDRSTQVTAAVAGNPASPPAVIARLAARHQMPAAGNPACPPDVLSVLTQSSSTIARQAATNPSCPVEALSAAARGDDWFLAAQVASDPRLPADDLEFLAGHERLEVRFAVAANPSSAEATLIRLAGDPSERVRASVLSNPNSTPSARSAVGLLAP